MTDGRRILFISNGYGEDNVAASLAVSYRSSRPLHTIAGFPTVGRGGFYEQHGIPVAGRGAELPSEGFVRSPKDFIRDVLHGLFRKTGKLGADLKKASAEYGFLIVVGDPYLLLFTSLCTGFPRERKVFIGLQQSEWYGSRKPFKLHYSALERVWLKRFSGLVIVRDTRTRDFLQAKGVNPVYSAGNPMMDCFHIPDEPLFPPGKTVVGVLPGSKKEAYDNFGNITATLSRLHRLAGNHTDLLFAVAFSPNLDLGVLRRRYALEETDAPAWAAAFTVLRSAGGGPALYFSKDHFGSILSESNVVLGLSGTANEQAAGLGKPVFSFWGEGPQITRKFLTAQKKLLGHALSVFPPDPDRVAAAMFETLTDEARARTAREDGMRRMAGRGSIDSIIGEIEAHLDRIDGL